MGLSVQNTPTPKPSNSKKVKKNLTLPLPLPLLTILLMLAALVLIGYLYNNNNSEKDDLWLDEIENKKILTLEELSILVRGCRAGQERFCLVLDTKYPMNRELERATQILKTPKNIHIREVDSLLLPIYPELKLFLISNKIGVGKILSTERVFKIGQSYFKEKLKKYLYENLVWVLIYSGYDIQQWEKNHCTDEEPQIEIHLTSPWRMLCISETTLAWKMLRKQGVKDIYNLTIKDFLAAYNAAKNKGEISKKLERDVEYTLKQYKILD